MLVLQRAGPVLKEKKRVEKEKSGKKKRKKTPRFDRNPDGTDGPSNGQATPQRLPAGSHLHTGGCT